jgi:hypothetical protein
VPPRRACSICDIYKLLGVPYFGAAGCVECSSFMTRVFKGLQVLCCVHRSLATLS